MNQYQFVITMRSTTRQLQGPTLSTIRMVEQTIRTHENSAVKIAELKRALPKQVNPRTGRIHTLLHILDYLQESGKILIGTKGVVWIYTSRAELERLKKLGTMV